MGDTRHIPLGIVRNDPQTPVPLEERVRVLEDENKSLREHIELLGALRARLAQNSEVIASLNHLGREINTVDREKISEICTRQIPALLNVRYASLFIYDYRKDELHLEAHNHPGEIHTHLTVSLHINSIMGLAVREKRIVYIQDIDEFQKTHGHAFERTFSDKYATRSCVSAPLTAGNMIVGVLNLADKTDGGYFDEMNDVPAIENLAQMLGIAIRNAQLFDEINLQARTDALTQLSNSRALQELLQNEVHRAARYQRQLSLLMVDLDGFKAVNDTYGHPAGDVVLKEVARILRAQIRREDIAARCGGDEFTIMLPETPIEGAQIVAERIRQSIEDLALPWEGHTLRVRSSIGVAPFRAAFSVTDFVKLADQALYKAKAAGKNRVVVADAPA